MRKRECIIAFAIIMIAVTAAMLGGCSRMYAKIELSEVKAYLEGKYNEEFYAYSSIGPSIDQQFSEWYFYSESHPDEMMKVVGDNNTLRDNYYGILIKEDFQSILDEAVSDFDGSAKVFFRFRTNTFAGEMTDPANLPKYLESDKEYFLANIFVFTDSSSEITEAMCEQLQNELCAKNITGTLIVHKIGKADLATLDDDNFQDYLSENYELRAFYSETMT